MTHIIKQIYLSMHDFLVDTWHQIAINSLSANFTKWLNTLKQFADELFKCV